jgi:hypothetical protein
MRHSTRMRITFIDMHIQPATDSHTWPHIVSHSEELRYLEHGCLGKQGLVSDIWTARVSYGNIVFTQGGRTNRDTTSREPGRPY